MPAENKIAVISGSPNDVAVIRGLLSDVQYDVVIARGPEDIEEQMDTNRFSAVIADPQALGGRARQWISRCRARGSSAACILFGDTVDGGRDLLVTVANILSMSIENANQYRRLKEQAVTDPLTGIANRQAFQEYFQREYQRSRRYGSMMSILLIDIDHFKSINDHFGHLAGDTVLPLPLKSAQRMKEMS